MLMIISFKALLKSLSLIAIGHE